MDGESEHVLHSHGSISFDLKGEVADCPEKPGALEANVLNQSAGSLAPGDHRGFHSRGKSSGVKRCTFRDYDTMASAGCRAP
jgi:hypothetical protein